VSEFSSSKRVLEAEILSLAAWVGHRRVQASKSSSSVDFHMLLLNGGFFLQIIRAVVENNLNASFVTIGLLASVPDLNQSIWVSFTKDTYFLRSDVTRISWLQRVLESDREAFERRMNASILGLDYNLKIVPRTTDAEYAPIMYASEDVASYIMADPMSLPTVKPGIENARDTGIVSVTAPDLYGGVWRMACYLAYYGESNPVSLKTVDMRRQTCLGYVGVSLAVEVVFASVLSR
jgi:hypothetical protein